MPKQSNFKPIFDYLDEMHQEDLERFDRIESQINSIHNSVDGLAKMVKDFRDERIILHRCLEVLEDWAKQVAQRTGIPIPV